MTDLKSYRIVQKMRENKWKEPEPVSILPLVVVFGIALVFVGLVLYGVKKESSHRPFLKDQCTNCHNRKMSMTNYFKKAGSKTPEEMAYAILQTRNPRLLGAIAKVESGGRSEIRNRGYKNRHDGAFQVNPRHWGRVPQDAVGQALQAEAILQELTGTMPLKKALSIYGGDSTSKYQRTILAELANVP